MDFTYHTPIVNLVKLSHGIGYTLKEAIQEDLDNGTLYIINVNDISSLNNLGIIYNPKYLSIASSRLLSMMNK